MSPAVVPRTTVHTKTATPLQYEKLSPLFAVRDIVAPSLFPRRGDNFKGVGGGDNFTGEGRKINKEMMKKSIVEPL